MFDCLHKQTERASEKCGEMRGGDRKILGEILVIFD